MKKNFLFGCPISLIIVLAIFLCGCSEKKPPGLPNLYPVSIQVTQAGVPLDEATVSLVSVDAGSNWIIGGLTDTNGKAQLRTYGKYIGAPAGRFKVVVVKQISEGEKEYVEAMNRNDLAAARKINVKIFSCVEDQFGDVKKTPLEIEINKSSKIITVDTGTAVRLKREFLR